MDSHTLYTCIWEYCIKNIVVLAYLSHFEVAHPCWFQTVILLLFTHYTGSHSYLENLQNTEFCKFVFKVGKML